MRAQSGNGNGGVVFVVWVSRASAIEYIFLFIPSYLVAIVSNGIVRPCNTWSAIKTSLIVSAQCNTFLSKHAQGSLRTCFALKAWKSAWCLYYSTLLG
jgi:hypothetical protein